MLDRNVEPDNPNGLKAVLLKTAADQLFWAPIMTCVFFVVLKSLEGHPELIWPTIQVNVVAGKCGVSCWVLVRRWSTINRQELNSIVAVSVLLVMLVS